MKKKSLILLGAGIAALSSQLYIDVLVADFRVTFALIALGIFIYENKEINPITMGFATAVSVTLWRVTVLLLDGTYTVDALLGFLPEVSFYLAYSLIVYHFVHSKQRFELDRYFIILTLADFSANVVEIVLRITFYDHRFYGGILTTLLVVALIRTSVVVLGVFLLRQQRLLVVREEHEKRYRRLLWMSSLLKSEIYWMDKSMDRVETAMSQAYQHFEAIQYNLNPEKWSEEAVNIAGSIHEIKKEYELVLRGVQDLLDVKYSDNGMTLSSILSILEEKMKKEADRRPADLKLKVEQGRDFFTYQHFLLMSIFRNLINNAYDAAEKVNRQVDVHLTHWTDGEYHVFQISDNGSGIEEDHLAHIFEAGFSTRINYDTGEINRGLGLSIVHSIVSESFGGTISVASVPNVSTSFKIRIPIQSLEDH